jgi:hypothetical protein
MPKAAGDAGNKGRSQMIATSMIGSWLVFTLFLIVWIAIAFWPARVAGRKGHSFIAFFIFSLVFFPAALIAAYLVPDRSVGTT